MYRLLIVSLAASIFQFTNAQNRSLEFDGVDDYVSIPHSSSLTIGSSPYAIELWFKSPDTIAFGTMIAKRQPFSPYNEMAIFINDGTDPRYTPSPGKKISFDFGDAVGTADFRSITTTSDVVDGAYHHLAVVVDPVAETLTMYIDGILQPVSTISTGSFPSVPNTENYVLGQHNGNSAWYSGNIDEVRIWHTTRTTTQIQDNMDTELTGSETGLTAYWKMDNPGSSCDIQDCNSNENHGTRLGTGGFNNLPQFSNDIPSLTNVSCGVSTICISDSTCTTTEVPDGLASTQTASSVLLSWNSIPNSVGCQVNGESIVPGSLVGSKKIAGFEVDGIAVPKSLLGAGSTWKWSVRCACSISPPALTGYSSLDTFSVPAAKQQAADPFLTISPSPLVSTAYISTDASNASLDMTFYNLEGKVVKQVFMRANSQLEVDVSDLPAGLYAVHATNRLGLTITDKVSILR